MSLVKHLEDALGPIGEGWGERGQIQVARFDDRPQPGVSTYSTIGFSQHALPAGVGNRKEIRAELVFSADSGVLGDGIASVLLTFSEYLVAQGRALLRGDVVGPGPILVQGSRMRAVYASIPVFFEDEFSVYRGTDPETVLIWLIPLYASEAEHVKAIGWSQFEDQLEANDVDFWNLNRPEIKLF